MESLLERLTPDYQNNYMDNIAQAVLLAAIGCGIAHKPVGLLKLDREDYDRIGYCLEGKSGVETEACIRTVMNHLLETFCPKEDTMKTVSYTHLDVYKRQVRHDKHPCRHSR